MRAQRHGVLAASCNSVRRVTRNRRRRITKIDVVIVDVERIRLRNLSGFSLYS
jgi:hypothetical protein